MDLTTGTFLFGQNTTARKRFLKLCLRNKHKVRFDYRNTDSGIVIDVLCYDRDIMAQLTAKYRQLLKIK